MDLRPHINRFEKRYAELESELSDPSVFDNQQRAQELTREYSRLKELVEIGKQFLKAASDLAENRELLKAEPEGSEMAEMAAEEVARLEA